MPHATNASVMRDENRKLILNLIRLQPISRVELAEQTHLTRASVTQIVDDLLSAGLVEEKEAVVCSSRGRRRVTLVLKGSGHYVFGVNIGRTNCHVGLMNLAGEVKTRCTLPVAGLDAAQVLQSISDAIAAMRKNVRGTVLGVGVCTPGPVDYVSGRVLNPPYFPGWQNVPLCGILSQKTGLKVLLERDTNARALEEKYFGSCRDVSNFMLLQIHRGVGAGVMIGDKLYRGAGGMGAEIGHTSVCFNGPVCTCGNRGCLELYLRPEHLYEGTEYSTWAEASKDSSVLRRCAEYLAAGLVNAVNLFDLERIVLSGDLAENSAGLLELLEPMIRQRVLNGQSLREPLLTAGVDVEPVRTGAMAVLLDFFQKR